MHFFVPDSGLASPKIGGGQKIWGGPKGLILGE